MKIIRKLAETEHGSEPLAVALGAFDGLHLGHKAVIDAARTPELPLAVFTFFDDPAVFFGAKQRDLTTPGERLEILERWGVDIVIMPEFAEAAGLSPAAFTAFLRERLGAKVLAAGENFRFGKGAAGNIEFLQADAEQYGLQLRIAETALFDGKPISATRIRDAVEAGDMKQASKMLGRAFGFKFPVVHGNHIGRTMGTPTINQHFPEGFVLPKFGVYASAVHVGETLYCGVTNVGVKPTVGSDRALSETWMPDFSGDLYGKSLRLELLDFIRPEKKFSGLEALRAEIYRNGEQAREIFAQAVALQDKAGNV